MSVGCVSSVYQVDTDRLWVSVEWVSSVYRVCAYWVCIECVHIECVLSLRIGGSWKLEWTWDIRGTSQQHCRRLRCRHTVISRISQQQHPQRVLSSEHTDRHWATHLLHPTSQMLLTFNSITLCLSVCLSVCLESVWTVCFHQAFLPNDFLKQCVL